MDYKHPDSVLHTTEGINLSAGSFRDRLREEMASNRSGVSNPRRTSHDLGQSVRESRVERMRLNYAAGRWLYQGLKQLD